VKEFLKRLFGRKPGHEPDTCNNIPYCRICGMNHKTGIYEFRKGDKVEVIAGMFDGTPGKVQWIDYRERNVSLEAGVCVGFDRVLNLTKGRADDVTGLLKRIKECE